MTIKRILFVLDDTSRNDTRLGAAIGLARTHDAAITGLHVITHPLFAPQGHDAGSKASECREIFERKTQQAGLHSEWIGVDTKVAGARLSEVVVHYAYFHDLIVVGQPEPDSQDNRISSDLAERIVFGAGRPVLFIPYAGVYDHIGDNVMIAWKAGRECARTAADAIPILEKAHDVKIMEVNQAESSDSDCISLCKYFRSHGITATPERIAANTVSLGDAILNRASIEGTDLLIMGAYAHGLMGMTTFGEVAKHIMKYMTLPVIMAH